MNQGSLSLTDDDVRALSDVEREIWRAHRALVSAERLLSVMPYDESTDAWRQYAAALRDQAHGLDRAVGLRLSPFDTAELVERGEA